jgi:hypothetical protein
VTGASRTNEWNDPTLLEQRVPSSAKVTLRDGEATTQDFRIGAAAARNQAGRAPRRYRT